MCPYLVLCVYSTHNVPPANKDKSTLLLQSNGVHLIEWVEKWVSNPISALPSVAGPQRLVMNQGMVATNPTGARVGA